MKHTLLIPALLMPILLSPLKSQASPKDSYEKVYKECMRGDDFKADDGALNAAYKKLIALLPPDRAAKLKADQTDWVKECAQRVKNDGRPHKNLESATISRKEELEEMVVNFEKEKTAKRP